MPIVVCNIPYRTGRALSGETLLRLAAVPGIAGLAPVSQALFAEPNPVVIKGVLHARGLIPSPAVRLPLLPATPDAVSAALALA